MPFGPPPPGWPTWSSPATIIANAGKGLEDATLKRFTQVIAEAAPAARVVALSGPSHAEEVARGVPTTVVSASEDLAAAERVQELLMNPSFRIYVNRDVTGVELGGALKNVVALAAGVVDGLDMGDNTKAALMTRGVAEMARLGVALGAQADTFAGLSGMGDLIVTCGSMHSRNRRAGILIGQGHTPEAAVKIVGTVEGYLAARAAWQLAQQNGVEMPITEQCYRVCYEGQGSQGGPAGAHGAAQEAGERKRLDLRYKRTGSAGFRSFLYRGRLWFAACRWGGPACAWIRGERCSPCKGAGVGRVCERYGGTAEGQGLRLFRAFRA